MRFGTSDQLSRSRTAPVIHLQISVGIPINCNSAVQLPVLTCHTCVVCGTFSNSERMLKIKLGVLMIILQLSTLAFSDDGSYSVVVTYQAALSNGTRVNISTGPSCPDRQVWLWVSSFILFILDPTNLNRGALYTLNHVTEWVPHHLTIAAPQSCSAKVEEFLTLMTTSVSRTMIVHCAFSCAHEGAPLLLAACG